MSNHLLIVDDDRALSPMVEEYLQAKGFKTTLCHNATVGLGKFKELKIDLCLLDVRMPMKDGFTLAEEIHEYAPDVPFLFLTSEAEKEKRIKGLKMGASDYILKPFSMEELYLRVQIILNRPTANINAIDEESSKFLIGSFSFNSHTRELNNTKQTFQLTTIEAKLLHMFCDSNDGFVNREMALQHIWNDQHLLRTRSLNVYVGKIRKYLSDDPSISFQNVHGVGYRMIIKQ